MLENKNSFKDVLASENNEKWKQIIKRNGEIYIFKRIEDVKERRGSPPWNN